MLGLAVKRLVAPKWEWTWISDPEEFVGELDSQPAEEIEDEYQYDYEYDYEYEDEAEGDGYEDEAEGDG